MSAFVGRDDALSAVVRALDRPPALVLVEGEAGIGKTRLVQECRWSGGWADRTVLTVECQPQSTTAPLGAVVDGVRQLRDGIGDLTLSPLAGALRPLFPEWTADLPPEPEPLDDSGARRHHLFRALTELLDRLGVELLVAEDAHWADEVSIEWLNAVCGPAGPGVSVVVTFRREDVPSGSLLWQLSTRRPSRMHKVHIPLEPLDVGAVHQLACDVLRHTSVSRVFAEFLHDRTGGLPLAVVECLRLLKERGDIVRDGDGWARRQLLDDIQVPPTVRDSVLQRVERLAPRTRRVLEAAAVLDEPANDQLLAAVAGLDQSAAVAAVAVGFRAGLLRGAGHGRVAFRHQLAAEAVAGQIPAPELARLHQRAGEALRAHGHAPAIRLSHHFREAGDTEAWAASAEQAAELAIQSGNDHTAVSLLYELLTSVDHPVERRARLARKLGEAAAGGAASLIDRAGLVMDALRQVLTDDGIPRGERGAIRLLLGRLLRQYGHLEAADHEIEAAIPDLEDQPALACRAMLNLSLVMSQDRPPQEYLDRIQQAKGLLPKINSSTERLQARALRVSALLVLGQEEGWSAAAELPQKGSNPTEQRTILLSMADIGRLAIKWGRYTEASDILNTATELIQTARYHRALNIARAGSAYLDWYTGQWAGLSQRATQLADLDTSDQLSIRIEAHEIQALLELATGSRNTAEQRLRAVLDEWTRLGPLGYLTATTAAALGQLQLAEGAAEHALQLTAPAMAKIARRGLWLWATDALPVHFDALAGLGRLAQADDLAAQLADWLAGRHAPAPAAAAAQCQAIMTEARGDLAAAAGLYAQAAAAWASLPRPYNELLTLERQGRCLLTADRVDHGLDVLTKAQQRLRDLGARWDADRLTRMLRQHGVEVQRTWRGGHRGYGDQLSPRERDVIALVAQGMTNREVGQAMFLSPKTVGLHLHRAMRKLGVTTRTAAAMAAAEEGLVPTTGDQPANQQVNTRPTG